VPLVSSLLLYPDFPLHQVLPAFNPSSWLRTYLRQSQPKEYLHICFFQSCQNIFFYVILDFSKTILLAVLGSQQNWEKVQKLHKCLHTFIAFLTVIIFH
jgi:hypothetical protein